MPDVGSSSFNEVDANNSDASPDGFPTGMAPSGLDNSARAVMGAVKRFWNRSNAVKTTAGTSSAYTLAFDQAASAYYDGEIISFVVNAANAAAATLNVNALGAIPLRLFAGNLLAGALLTDQIVQARYNTSAGAFDIIPQNGWVRIGEQDPSAASAVDFTSIPAGVKHLMLVAELTVNTNAVSMNLRTYGADGVIDTGASDYSQNLLTSAGGAVAGATSNGSAINLAGDVATGTTGFSTSLVAANIQASTTTKFTFNSLHQGSVNYTSTVGVGSRSEADRITGIRVYPTSGTTTGKLTLFGSA